MHLVIVISIIASIIAGVGTGLVGLSAATAITPLLIKCGVPVHQAIYIALISDVVASAFTSREYALNGHLLKNNGEGNTNLPTTWLVFGFTIFFTLIGAYVSSKVTEKGVGTVAFYVSLFVAVKFIFGFVFSQKHSERSNQKAMSKLFASLRNCSNNVVIIIATIIGGAIIGLTSGFAGVGGGMTMLIVFGALGYKLKDAVCVSTLTMVFVAMIGGALHYYLNDKMALVTTINGWTILSICVAATTLSAWITSKFANKCCDKYHKLLCGILLLVALIVTKIF